MNAKSVFGLLACAAVSAVAFNAYANTTTNWFGASASGTALTLTTAVTNGAAVTVSDGKITLNNDYSSLLSVAPETASPALNDGLVTITSSAFLTPCSTNDLPAASTISDAQVGFAVAYDDTPTSNYYYYVRSGASAGTWTKWPEPAVPTGTSDTTFIITLDYRKSKVKFTVGENSTDEILFVPATATLANVAAFGTGTLTSIDTKYEVATCAVVSGSTTNKYGSVADAKAAGGTASNISYINSKGTAVSAAAANGMSAAVCVAVGLDPTSETAVLRAVPVATDSDASNITLQLATTAESGVTYTVKNASSETVSTSTDATAIKIPTDTGVYTITPSLTE